MKGTILEAIQATLKQFGSPMDVHDIHKSITEKNLYAFKAKDPVGVIRKALRRHSDNVETKDASRMKYFEVRPDGKYALVDATRA
jgi:hypothetical protein